jgi:hypothetical protein
MNITEALDHLDKWQAQIIHGKPTFREIGDVIRELERQKDTAEMEAENLRTALKNCLGWTHRAMELEVSGSMLMAATEHAEAARSLLENS